MKSSVTINGITLSRAQVEQAMNELQEPEFEPGDVIKSLRTNYTYLVISRELWERFRPNESLLPNEIPTVSMNGRGTGTLTHSEFVRKIEV